MGGLSSFLADYYTYPEGCRRGTHWAGRGQVICLIMGSYELCLYLLSP
jgi:hypothetical protein